MSLATIANQVFTIDPEGITHDVGTYGARPDTTLDVTTPGVKPEGLDI